MRLLTCEQCPEDIRNKGYKLAHDCAKKQMIRNTLVGNHVQWTSIQFHCTRIKKNLRPGLVVSVQITTNEGEGMEYEATIMEWRGRKVRVWLHEPDEYVKSKWDSIKVWPKQISCYKTDRVFERLCPECKRPLGRKRTRTPNQLNAGTDIPREYYCSQCGKEERSTS